MAPPQLAWPLGTGDEGDGSLSLEIAIRHLVRGFRDLRLDLLFFLMLSLSFAAFQCTYQPALSPPFFKL